MLTVQEIKDRVKSSFSEDVKILTDLASIPSISSSSFEQGPVKQSAEKVAQLFSSVGCEAEVTSSEGPDGWQGRPAVIARKVVSADAPTVLLYAHHDVQPVGNLEAWRTKPFEPVIQSGRLFGRGTSDDKAGVVLHLAAIRALAEDLAVNVTVFVEGEEEVGSPSFVNFVHEHRDKLDADIIIVADSDNWKVGQPAITTSLRGVVQAVVTVKVLEHAVHSGMYGGPVLDAHTIAARLISTLHDENGDVSVPGLSSSSTAGVEYEETDLRADVGSVPGLKLAGTGDIAARMWTKPAISVIGMDIPSVAASSNTIAAQSKFVLSLRVAPGQSIASATEALEKHLLHKAPFGAEVSVKIAESGPGYIADLESPVLVNLRWAMAQAWGVEPVDIGVGGSIPFISHFREIYPRAQVLVTGVEDPATNAHSENESQHLGDLESAIVAEALLLARLADQV